MTETMPTPGQIKRWRQYLADERAEASVYRDLAKRRDGEEHAILMALAAAEGRHEQHWLELLGPHAKPPVRPSPTQPMLMPLSPWPPMNRFTRKSFAACPPEGATGFPDLSVLPCLEPTTAL